MEKQLGDGFMLRSVRSVDPDGNLIVDIKYINRYAVNDKFGKKVFCIARVILFTQLIKHILKYLIHKLKGHKCVLSGKGQHLYQSRENILNFIIVSQTA